MRWVLLSGLLMAIGMTVSSAAYGPIETGTYPLKMVTLDQPWWLTCGFAAVGYEGPPEPGGALTGEVWLPGGTVKVSINVRRPQALKAIGVVVSAMHVMVTLDANGNKQTEDDATFVAKRLPPEHGGSSARYSVSVRDPKTGADVLLGIELDQTAYNATISRIITPVPAADIKSGAETRRVYCADAGAYGTRVWLDENGDGVVQSQEEFPGVYWLGSSGGLRSLTPDIEKMRLVVKALPAAGRLRVTVSNAAGKPAQVARIMGYGRGGQMIQLAPSGDVEAFEGLSQVSVSVAIGSGREASFSGAVAPPTAVGKVSGVSIRGPVKIQSDVETQGNGSFTVSATLKAASGHQLTSVAGPGETRGKVKVYAPDGTLLSTGFLEFG
jgi:hypothetical protein